MEERKQARSAAMLCLIVSACGNTPSPHPVDAHSLYGSKVFFRPQCVVASPNDLRTFELPAPEEGQQPTSPEAGVLGALIGELAPSVLNKLIDMAAAYAESRSKEYSSSTLASSTAVWPRVTSTVKGCIIYVAGRFGESIDAGSGGQNWDKSKLNEFGLSAAPDVYAEWALHFVDREQKNLTVSPVSFEFRKPQAIRTGRANAKQVAFVVELSVPSNAGAKVGGGPPVPPLPMGATPQGQGSTIASFPISMGNVAVGSSFGARSLKGLTAPSQSQVVGQPSAVNVSVAAFEVEDGGEFLLSISQFGRDNKSTITEVLSPYIRNKVAGAAQK